jgi:hypothetical protein
MVEAELIVARGVAVSDNANRHVARVNINFFMM